MAQIQIFKPNHERTEWETALIRMLANVWRNTERGYTDATGVVMRAEIDKCFKDALKEGE